MSGPCDGCIWYGWSLIPGQMSAPSEGGRVPLPVGPRDVALRGNMSSEGGFTQFTPKLVKGVASQPGFAGVLPCVFRDLHSRCPEGS